TFGLPLRQDAEMADLCAREERRGRVGTRRDAGPASDAGCCVHGPVRILLRYGNRVPIGCTARGNRDESSGANDPIKRAAIHDKVADNRERLCTQGLEVENIAVLKMTHVELANCGTRLRAVRDAVDHKATRSADSFA